jgi:folate-binding protein YgfZ
MNDFCCNLQDRAIISLSGEHRYDFLQGLVSNNVYLPVCYTLMLSPQGKFLYDFFIVAHQEQLLLDCAVSQLATIIKTLNMYKLRSKVVISAESSYKIISSNQPMPNAVVSYQDPRKHELCYRSIVTYEVANSGISYDELRIALGVPEGEKDMIAHKSYPLEFGMDNFNAIDFNKGCYVGQEVTARTKHRGVIRKKIYHMNGENLPLLAEDIMLKEQKIGVMCSSVNNQGLALLRTDLDYALPVEFSAVS